MYDLQRLGNQQAISQLQRARPTLKGIRPAAEVMRLAKNTILTSGPRLPFSEYVGGQRSAIIGGALYEGLAPDEESAIQALNSGEIAIEGCQTYDCVGSLAGITTASMPVVIVEDSASGNQSFCTLYEGDAADRLNYGSYTHLTRENLEYLRLVVAPALNDLIQEQVQPIDLKKIMVRALTMGDDLHSRNAAATLLLFREIMTGHRAAAGSKSVGAALNALKDDYFFLRLSMAASKLMANAMRDIPHSSLVTSMAFSCKEFGIQISGLGDTWFTGPVPTFEDYKIEQGHAIRDMEIMGGESTITEVVGLGGLSQAASFPLVRASGGDVKKMLNRTLSMYDITFAESTEFRIPSLNYRGIPLGIDVTKVVEMQRPPYLNIGMAGQSKRQIGGGVAIPPIEPFQHAMEALYETTLLSS